MPVCPVCQLKIMADEAAFRCVELLLVYPGWPPLARSRSLTSPSFPLVDLASHHVSGHFEGSEKSSETSNRGHGGEGDEDLLWEDETGELVAPYGSAAASSSYVTLRLAHLLRVPADRATGCS
jgi:hypothetical protein